MQLNKNCDQKSDEELIILALKNQDYYACIVDRYEKKIANYIKRIAGLNNEDTEDLLQDIFIKVYQNLNGFDPSLKFSSWIYRIAHNEIISNWRKKKAKPQFVGGEEIDEFLDNIASEMDIHKDVENKSIYDDIKKVLKKIDIKYREVLILKFLEEKTYEEISDILKKPSGTIATLINRAKKQFKKETGKMKIEF
ncbi:MAG: sigma-70 family RNA polymerase sigma factor [Patescibacteria group bacterium]|jgi:RNA polymerase sigma-70 factor (ECF subfamily)